MGQHITVGTAASAISQAGREWQPGGGVASGFSARHEDLEFQREWVKTWRTCLAIRRHFQARPAAGCGA
jgi:hypothetical protein